MIDEIVFAKTPTSNTPNKDRPTVQIIEDSPSSFQVESIVEVTNRSNTYPAVGFGFAEIPPSHCHSFIFGYIPNPNEPPNHLFNIIQKRR